MSGDKKKPQRICAACRKKQEKRCLIRIVKNVDGHARADARQKSGGRGAYLCLSLACIQRAQKTRALQRSLGCSADEAFFTELERLIEDIDG